MLADYTEELELKMRAEAPIVQLVAHDWILIMGAAKVACEKNNKELFVWNHADGLRKFDFTDHTFIQVDAEMTDPVSAIAWFREPERQDCTLIMEDLYLHFSPNTQYYLQVIANLRSIAKSEGSSKVLVLSQPVRSLPEVLEKDVYVLDITLPDLKRLRSTLKKAVDGIQSKKADFLTPTSEDMTALAEAAMGMTVSEALTVFTEVGLKKGHLTAEDVMDIVEQKEQMIKKSGILEYFHPSESMLDVGGMDNLKEWLRRRSCGFLPDASRYGCVPPKGVLLLGVQGCGKSLIAKAIASEWKKPLLKFDLGKVFGGVVGESEGNIRKALDTAKAIAPCILWIDEIEKGLSGVGSSDRTDGGTSARVFGTLLTWMQEKKEPVFVVATSNNISQMPPELLRKGRFDEIFFVDLPGQKSREDIWRIHLEKKIGVRLKDAHLDLNKLAKLSQGFSGAEIEEAINEGLYTGFSQEREVQMSDFEIAIKKTVPLSKVMDKVLSDLRTWAKNRAQLANTEEVDALPSTGVTVPRLKSERISILED